MSEINKIKVLVTPTNDSMNLLRFLTPLNLAEEKDKFFSNPSYNPKFHYIWLTQDVSNWIESNIIYQPLCNAVVNQDYTAIVSHASKLFETNIEPSLLSQAEQIVTNLPDKLETQSISTASHAFKQAFQALGLKDYRLQIVDSSGFNFRPDYTHKRVVMSEHANFDFFSIEGEVKHELSHIIRYENGLHNQIKASSNYLPTEEGLATYCQDYQSQSGQTSLFQHAAEYAVTPIALKGSLREVINYLVSLGFSNELAWQRAVRHKYGWVDTSKPGDIMKPSMYFHHQQQIKTLNPDDRMRLFVGKISLDELRVYQQYRGLIPLDLLTSFFPNP